MTKWWLSAGTPPLPALSPGQSANQTPQVVACCQKIHNPHLSKPVKIIRRKKEVKKSYYKTVKFMMRHYKVLLTKFIFILHAIIRIEEFPNRKPCDLIRILLISSTFFQSSPDFRQKYKLNDKLNNSGEYKVIWEIYNQGEKLSSPPKKFTWSPI